jgi:TonB family protein
MGMSAAAEQPTVIDVQLSSVPAADEPSGGSGTVASAGGAAPAPAAAPAATPAATPRSKPAPGEGSGFVIPTPAGRSAESSAAVPRGPSFKTSGSRTGAAESLPPVPSTEPQPAVTVGQQGKTTGASSGSGSTQHGGQGVLVNGTNGKTADSLDFAPLDKTLAGRGSGTGGAAAAGSGTGGSGTGTGGSGSSSGSGTGKGGEGAGVTGAPNYQLELPDSSKGRTVRSSVKPKIPAWVSEQGLAMSVTVSFNLMPDGLVSAVSTVKSTGYADVDSAVLEAIRRWRFTPASGGGQVKGVITYKIRTR